MSKGDLELGLLMALIISVLVVLFAIQYLADQTSIAPSDESQNTVNEEQKTLEVSEYLNDLSAINNFNEYNDTFAEDSVFCDMLKRCVSSAYYTGEPCLVGNYNYNGALATNFIFPDLTRCKNDINLTVGPGIMTKCIFGTSQEKFVYDANGLLYSNCSFDADANYEYVDYEVALDDDKSYFFASKDYFMTRGFSHYPVIESERNPITGPWRAKIVIGNVRMHDNVCAFDAYFCVQPTFANSANNSTAKIFDLFKNFDIYSRLNYPYYIIHESGPDYDILYFPDYEVALDSKYNVALILEAIRSGLYKNMENSRYTWYHPHWDTKRFSGINYNGLMLQEYTDRIESNLDEDRTRSIYFDCGTDNVCENKIKITPAIRIDYDSADYKLDSTKPAYWSLIITIVDVGN